MSSNLKVQATPREKKKFCLRFTLNVIFQYGFSPVKIKNNNERVKKPGTLSSHIDKTK